MYWGFGCWRFVIGVLFQDLNFPYLRPEMMQNDCLFRYIFHLYSNLENGCTNLAENNICKLHAVCQIHQFDNYNK